MLTAVAISNYRSLRSIIIPLQNLNIVTGANGSSKSNFYRALRLLRHGPGSSHSVTCKGGWFIVHALGRSGIDFEIGAPPGICGGRDAGQKPVTLQLGFASDDLSYCIDLGLPRVSNLSAFAHDPEIKRECGWHGAVLRPSTLLVDRNGSLVRIRAGDGSWHVATQSLATFDSMMTHIADPQNAPETLILRESIRAWRFYDHFRTDIDAPARPTHLGTRTPILADDGSDIAAAIETIRDIGDANALAAAVADAFPESELWMNHSESRFTLLMKQHGLLRPLAATELSDGTLRYLLWIAALLTPRPPVLMVLNEPETSLHPDLLAPLARLIARAAEKTQIVVVTHAAQLVAALREHRSASIPLEKSFGETRIAEEAELEVPPWHWPAR